MQEKSEVVSMLLREFEGFLQQAERIARLQRRVSDFGESLAGFARRGDQVDDALRRAKQQRRP